MKYGTREKRRSLRRSPPIERGVTYVRASHNALPATCSSFVRVFDRKFNAMDTKKQNKQMACDSLCARVRVVACKQAAV